MKVKLIAVTILSAISLNASALELYKSKVVDSKTWTTGKVSKAYFTEGNTPNIAAVKAGFRDTFVDTHVADQEGYAKGNTYVYGSHSFYISNPTNLPEMYLYEYKLCVDGDNCIYKADHLEIGAGGHATDSGSTTIAQYFDKPGTYDSYALTRISGYAHDYKDARGHVYIRKLA